MLFSFAFALYFLALYVYGIKFSKKKNKKTTTLHGDKSPLDSSLQHKLETRPVSAVIPSSVFI